MTTDIKEKTATKTAEQKIVDALSKVLPDAVWPVVLPQDPAYPAFSFNRINYELKSESPDLNPLKLNAGTGNKSTFQMVIYAKQYTKCAALLRQAKQAMESEGLVLESVEDGYEFEQLVFVIVTEWSIWGELEADNRKPANQYPVLAKITKAIIQTLKDNFECIPCIELYHPNKRQLTTPALILETESLAMGASLGDGRTPLRISFVLHCLMPAGTDDANLQGLAALVCQLIYQNTWQQDNLSFPDNSLSNAAVLAGLYTKNNPKTASADNTMIAFGDGSLIEYDQTTHALNATLAAGATATITADGGITLNGDVTVNGNVSAAGDVSDSAGSIQEFRDEYKKHTHMTNTDGPTGKPL